MKIRILFAALVFCIIVKPAYSAQSTITEAEGNACMGDDKSRKQTEDAALIDAKKKAVEYVSTHIKSETEVKNFVVEKDLLAAYANAEVKIIKDLSREWYKDINSGDCLRLKIKAEVIPDLTVAANVGQIEIETGLFYKGADGKLIPVREGMSLTSHDNYAVYIKAKQPCNLYVYQIDATNKAFRLFPNPEFIAASNPISQNTDYWIPEKGFLFLDEIIGSEDLYVFATRKPAKELDSLNTTTAEQLTKTIKTMGVAGKRGDDNTTKVKSTSGNMIDIISRRLISQGDFYYKISFVHQ